MNPRSPKTLPERFMEWLRGLFDQSGGRQQVGQTSTARDESSDMNTAADQRAGSNDTDTSPIQTGASGAQKTTAGERAGTASSLRHDDTASYQFEEEEQAAFAQASRSGQTDRSNVDADVSEQKDPAGPTGASSDEFVTGGHDTGPIDEEDIEAAAEPHARQRPGATTTDARCVPEPTDTGVQGGLSDPNDRLADPALSAEPETSDPNVESGLAEEEYANVEERLADPDLTDEAVLDDTAEADEDSADVYPTDLYDEGDLVKRENPDVEGYAGGDTGDEPGEKVNEAATGDGIATPGDVEVAGMASGESPIDVPNQHEDADAMSRAPGGDELESTGYRVPDSGQTASPDSAVSDTDESLSEDDALIDSQDSSFDHSDITETVSLDDADVAAGGSRVDDQSQASDLIDDSGTGSLTNPADAAGGAFPNESPAARTSSASGQGETPRGATRGDGTNTCPTGFPIKGNANSKIYHVPGRASYESTVPEWCFATEEDAINAGYRAPKS